MRMGWYGLADTHSVRSASVDLPEPPPRPLPLFSPACRLQLVSALLPVVGMAGRAGEGFQLEAVMDFVGPALSNSSAEVRGAAVALTLQVAQLAGPSVQRLLPAGLNAKVKEQIEAGLLNPTAALPAQPAKAPAAAKPAAAPAAAPTAAPAARKPAQQATPVAAAAVLPSPPPPHPAALEQQAALPAPGPDDDPSVFEADVRAREARLGPSHPDVAEAICNLAIVHNQVGRGLCSRWPAFDRWWVLRSVASASDATQIVHHMQPRFRQVGVTHMQRRSLNALCTCPLFMHHVRPPLLPLLLQRGNASAALPLYERALAIWEAASGPESPVVAHTLTDIAVIHLEMVGGGSCCILLLHLLADGSCVLCA